MFLFIVQRKTWKFPFTGTKKKFPCSFQWQHMEISISLSLNQVTSQMPFGGNFVRGICTVILDTVTVTNLYSVQMPFVSSLKEGFSSLSTHK